MSESTIWQKSKEIRTCSVLCSFASGSLCPTLPKSRRLWAGNSARRDSRSSEKVVFNTHFCLLGITGSNSSPERLYVIFNRSHIGQATVKNNCSVVGGWSNKTVATFLYERKSITCYIAAIADISVECFMFCWPEQLAEKMGDLNIILCLRFSPQKRKQNKQKKIMFSWK